MKDDAGGDSVVAEINGLEGAFTFAELLLQRIWSRLDFDQARAQTTEGKSIRIVGAGRWNKLGGPDFLGATLEIGGRRVTGDVEVHLRARDWDHHGHGADMNYSRVILHVVLFPVTQQKTFGWDRQEVPVLVLLPLLNRSLEEYAEEDAVERLANHPLAHARDALLALPMEKQHAELRRIAKERWSQKCVFTALRCEHLNWEAACHHTALEILGYRFNRAPMLGIAQEFPLNVWTNGLEDRIVDAAFNSQTARWHRQAIRPANFPQARLRQYAKWAQACPDWPNRLLELAESLPKKFPNFEATPDFRRRMQTQKLWDRVASHLCGGALSGTRLNTFVCDGIWPLLASAFSDRSGVFEALWFHGYPGDLPENIREINHALAKTDFTHKPLSHGLAQGLLGWSGCL